MTKRDIGKEILDSIHSIKEGKGKRFKIKPRDSVKSIREKLGLR
jgi:hypothetical protein